MSAEIAQAVVSALTVGSMYALIAVGVTLIYAATGIINFAQGEFVMLGGMTMVTLYGERHWPLAAAIPATLAFTVVVAAALMLVSFRSGSSGRLITVLIISIGASMALSGGAYHLWDGDVHRFPAFSGETPFFLLGAAIPPQALWVIGTAVAATLALSAFLRLTIWGKAMRACAIDRGAAELMGIRVGSTVLLSFMMAGALGCIAGIVVTPLTLVDYGGGWLLALKGFSAAMLGGMGSVVGAILGAMLFALLETFSVTFVSAAMKELSTFVVIILVLMIMPQGLMGGRSREGLTDDDVMGS